MNYPLNYSMLVEVAEIAYADMPWDLMHVYMTIRTNARMTMHILVIRLFDGLVQQQ